MIELAVSAVYVVAIFSLLRRWSKSMQAQLDMTAEAALDRMSLCMYMAMREIGTRIMPALAEGLASFAQAADGAAKAMRDLEDTFQSFSRLDIDGSM